MSRNAPKDLSSKKPEKKQFYFLVAGTVFFTTAEAPEEPVSLPANTVISNETGQLTTFWLGRAQEGLAQSVADKLGSNVGMNLYDVQLVNISKLGHMLPSEFHDVKFDVGQPAPEQSPEDFAPAKVQ